MSKRSVKRKRVESEPEQNVESIDPIIEFQGVTIDIIADDETYRLFVEKFSNSNSKESDDDYEVFNDLVQEVVLRRLYIEADSDNPDPDKMDSSSDIEDESETFGSKYPRVGDRVSVSYTPASQKYIEHYADQAFRGEVFFVDPERDNFFMWNHEVGPVIDGKIKLTYRIQSYKREGCHFFGMSDCYFGHYSFY